WSSPSRIRDMPGRMPPRANPDGSDTDGSSAVPSFLATLLKLPISALLTTVSTTNLIGALAAVLTASHAVLIESFMESKASETPSVEFLNSGWIVSRNQLATGAITLSLTKFQAALRESRIVLNPVFTESITPLSKGQAVFLNQFTTGLMTLSLTNCHAFFKASRITSKPSLIASITVRMVGHAVFWNHDTTGLITLSRMKLHAACNAFFMASNPSWINLMTISSTGHTHVRNHDTTAWTAPLMPFHTETNTPQSHWALPAIRSHAALMNGTAVPVIQSITTAIASEMPDQTFFATSHRNENTAGKTTVK